MFLRKVAKLIHDAPEEMGHLVPLLREAILREAKIFTTPEALKTYLREHPEADKSKHTVRKLKHKDPKDAKDFSDQVKAIGDNFELKPFQRKDMARLFNSPEDTKDIASMAKRRLNLAESEIEDIEDPKGRADAKKEMEKARKRVSPQLTTLEETLTKKLGDPRRARAIRDWVESSTMFSLIREQISYYDGTAMGKKKKPKKED